MKVQFLFASVAVCAASALLLAGSASAQWSSGTKVSNVIEGSGFPAGVSAARCGNGVVVGFGDTEANTPGSDVGFAVSKDGGSTFADRGVLADPSLRFGGGDSPVIGCASANTFYYATLGFSSDPAIGCAVDCAEVAVSISTNGGSSWQPPVVASWVTLDIYDIVQPSLAIDPTNPKRLYSAYINHNSPGPNDFSDCDNFDEYILEIVSSADGGKTWNKRANPGQRGNPSAQPDHTCTGTSRDAQHTGILQTPMVVVSPGGKVYVAYEFVATSVNGVIGSNEIRFTRSLDGGGTFSAPITVSKDAINNALPQLAVDRTGLRSRGEIYLTWSGSPTGTSTDVLVSDSVNFGLSFSFPRSVRATSQGTQINPVLAVDNDGQVATCYYVTGTNTPTSSSNYFYNCLTSFNHAATWTGYQKLVTSAPPGFDALTSDFLLHNDGFFTAFEVSTSGQRHVVGAKSDN